MTADAKGRGQGTDVFTPAERSAVMRKVPGKNSSPELKVRKLLTALGLRYRLHRKDLPGSPDIALPGRKTAVFVHGCFWHGHDCRRGARMPKTNAGYWTAKIARNRARDAAAAEALTAMGWRPLVVWECELKDAPALKARLVEQLGLQTFPEPLIPAHAGTQAFSAASPSLDKTPGSPPARG